MEPPHPTSPPFDGGGITGEAKVSFFSGSGVTTEGKGSLLPGGGVTTGEAKGSPPLGGPLLVNFVLSVTRPPSGWTSPSAADADRLRTVMLPAALPPFRIQARLIADQQLVITMQFSSFTIEAERDPVSIKARMEGYLLSESPPGATGVARALLRSSTCHAQLLGEVSVIDEQECLALREPKPVPSRGQWAEVKAAPFEHRGRAPKPPKRERVNIPDNIPFTATGTPLDLLCCALLMCMFALKCAECLCDMCERPEHAQESARS